MTSHFDLVRLPADELESRVEAEVDLRESGEEHRNRVLQCLLEAVHDGLVARALHRLETGEREDSEEFTLAHWSPIWTGLRESLTRQDLLRWLMDWAAQVVHDRVVDTVDQVVGELEDLDTVDGLDRLTETNPG